MTWCLVKHRDSFTFTFLIIRIGMNMLQLAKLWILTLSKEIKKTSYSYRIEAERTSKKTEGEEEKQDRIGYV
jgi:hypothetical protein